jgi:hypothetical protein
MAQMRMITSLLLASSIAAAGCDMGKLTVNTTAKVLVRAQPSIQMESDYDLAARAIPGTLKTVEGFWVVNPDNDKLTGILTEGYCQYGTAFVEDEWEHARLVTKDLEGADYLSQRATKIFTRCLNYALHTLGKRWQDGLFGEPEAVAKLVAGAGGDQRNALMWAGLALGSIVNHNLDNIDIVSNLPTVKAIMARILELDAKHLPENRVYAALPHIALGMLYSATSADLGGDAKKAEQHFLEALRLTNDQFLMARTLYAFRIGKATMNKQLYREQLIKVLTTNPAIWPEQRLANEAAQRKARRYLQIEKEIVQ